MDSRHEIFEQELLNQLIILINHYITEVTDDLLNHQTLLNEIQELALTIFTYLGIKVDIDGILTKKNLLSIDVVTFPHLDDPTHDILNVNDRNHLKQLISDLHLIIKKYEMQGTKHNALNQSVKRILCEHSLP